MTTRDRTEASPLLRGPLLGLGLGLLAGGLEAVQIALTVKLALSFGQALALAALCAALGGLLGAAAGLAGGALAALLTRSRGWLPYRRSALALAFAAVFLGCWYLWPAARQLAGQGRAPLAFLAALTPLFIGGVTWLNAQLWLRKEYIGEGAAVGWRWLSLAGATVLALAAAALAPPSAPGTAAADAADRPDVLLITVDTLRRDHVSAYGADPFGAGVPAQTPILDGLARGGILYANAVTPMPETLPAHSAMFTGLHPARSGVLSNGHRLAPGHHTLAEALAAEGYATGAFVSSFAVDSRTGIDQGFQVFDDDFFPLVRGFSEIQAAGFAVQAAMRLLDPTDFPFLLERPAPVTFGRALDWLGQQGATPAFTWVHLFEPHSPYEPHGLPGFEDNGTPGDPSVDHRWILSNEAGFTYTDEVRAKLRRLYAEEVAYTDQQIGAFLESARALSRGRPLLLIIAADHGEMLGEHGIEFNHHGIWEEAVQVPLIVVPTRPPREPLPPVAHQARLVDLPATVLRQAKLEGFEKTESRDLLPLAVDPEAASHSTLLLGRKTASLAEGTLFGYRARVAESGPGEPGAPRAYSDVKYIWSPDEGKALLFDLGVHPREQRDLAGDDAWEANQQRLHSALQQDAGALVEGVPAPAVDGATSEALKALGYIE